MSDRPAEIWCETGLYWDYKKDWSEGSWRDKDKYGGEKYVRADRIDELEAKLAKAVEELENMQKVPRSDASYGILMVMLKYTVAELKGQKDE
jgi:hypothetical protein